MEPTGLISNYGFLRKPETSVKFVTPPKLAQLLFAPCKEIREILVSKTQNPGNFGLWNSESGKSWLVQLGIGEILACKIRNRRNFCMWNPDAELWLENTAQGIRNPSNDWNPESKFYWQRIRNPAPAIRNPRCGRMSVWIPLHIRAWGGTFIRNLLAGKSLVSH